MNDFNYYLKEAISHSGVDGQKWYQHRFGNWERHAKYANGQPNPETMAKQVKENIQKDYRKDFKNVYWNAKDENGKPQSWEMPADEAGKIMKAELNKKINERFDGTGKTGKQAYVKEYDALLKEYIDDTRELDNQYKVMREVANKNKQDMKEMGFSKAYKEYKNSGDAERMRAAQKYEQDYLNKYKWMISLFG